jgi:hypothetical protein
LGGRQGVLSLYLSLSLVLGNGVWDESQRRGGRELLYRAGGSGSACPNGWEPKTCRLFGWHSAVLQPSRLLHLLPRVPSTQRDQTGIFFLVLQEDEAFDPTTL